MDVKHGILSEFDPVADGLTGMTPREVRSFEPADPPRIGEGRFLLLGCNYHGHLGLEYANENDPHGLAGGGGGFSTVLEKPHLTVTQLRGRMHDYQPFREYALVSRAWLDFCMMWDAAAFTSIPVDLVRRRSGEDVGEFFFFDVTRRLRGLDMNRFRGNVTFGGELFGKDYYYMTGRHSFAVVPDIAPEVHLFRERRNPSLVFCSREFAAAATAKKFKGVAFRDAAKL